ncbi:hypothetical protein EC968_002286 [Mortierella alpina]|nr:hypothetical protein EC968_002286 [Mortierella alpina]
MARDDPVDLNHIALDINDKPDSLDPTPSPGGEIEEGLEVGNPMLGSSSDISSTGDPEIKAQAAVPIVPRDPVVHKWYFKTKSTTNDDENECSFDCCDDDQPPVTVDLSMRFASWTFPTKNIESGLYDVIIGLITPVNVDPIESLTFRFATVDGKSVAPRERIWKDNLKAMCGTVHDPVKWRLCLQMEQTKEHDVLKMMMETRPSYGTFSERDIGHFDLHFMELRSSENADFDTDASIVAHQPWIWSLDVHHGSRTTASKSIIHYDVSGDRSRVATLSVTENQLILELWDIGGSNKDPNPAAATGADIDVQLQDPSTESVLCATVQVPVTALQNCDDLGESFSVSTSWDGSQVVLLDSRHFKKDDKSLFAIYRYNQSHRLLEYNSEDSEYIQHSYTYLFQQLPFRGKFHVLTSSDQGAQEKTFIVCTRRTVQIYRVSQKWKLLKTIWNCYNYDPCPPPLSPRSRHYAFNTSDGLDEFALENMHLTSFRRLGAGCLENYLVWDGADYVAVWDMERESPISLKILQDVGPAGCSISDDKSMLAVLSGNLISVNDIALETEIQSTQLQGYHFTEVRFIRNDTQLLVQSSNKYSEYNEERYGLILDTSGLFIVTKILMPGHYIDVVKSPGMDDRFYAAHGSRLRHFHLEDCILKPYSQPYIPSCDATCKDNLTQLDAHESAYTARNGLQFTATWKQDTPSTLAVTMTGAAGVKPKELLVPFEKNSGSGRLAVFLDKLHRLLVADGEIITVWALPETADGDLTLIFLGYSRGTWGTCQHQQLLCPDGHSSGGSDILQCLPIEQLNDINSSIHFLIGFEHLFDLHLKDKSMKKRVEQYINRHINRVWPMKRPLRADKTDMTIDDVQSMQCAEIIIDYCFRRARDDKEMGFVLPVMQYLNGMFQPNYGHLDFAHRVLRQSVHLPVKNREFLLNNYIIMHPPRLRLRFWKSHGPELFECKDSVLQMVCGRPIDKFRGPMGNYYKHDLFVASFHLLWHVYINPPSKISHESSTVSYFALRSLVMIPLHVMRHKYKLIHGVPVRAHKFHLDMMDNPAIAALIEYKWNTIGFKYWLVRFLAQCCFYGLVLTTVFKQVYGGHARAPAGIYIAMLVSSSLFLLLEVAQMISNWERYRSSRYNVVDLAVFGLPLAGSINQLMIVSGKIQGSTANDGNAGIFSFSVIFIFLHAVSCGHTTNTSVLYAAQSDFADPNILHSKQLFELRVNSTVCKFATIITGVIGEIRGIIAFTIATQHILRACPFDECSDPTTKLPYNFFYALSATYFFMGGRYDAVNEDFNSENWQFHVLMMIYLFFTVILMLNVLIALINMAFSDGDETWRRVWCLNRLQVVESAENLSYHIPGYRENSPWFPKEIYYTATKKQVQEYREKYLSDEKQDLIAADEPEKNDPEDPWIVLQTQQEALKQEMASMRVQADVQLEQLQKQSTAVQTQNESLTKQNDNLTKRLEDMQKSVDAQTTSLEAIMDELRRRLPPSS